MLETPVRRRPEFYLSADDPSQSRVLPCDLESAAVARRLVAAVLACWGLPELTTSAELIVSELVTNAVLHARTCGSSVRAVVTRVQDDRVQVAVTDLDQRPPVLVQAGPDEEGGRGLALVAALSECWGCEHRHWGKRVWAELALS
ncbi:ATP-binding protein [Streptomyces sp. NRRL B-24572]|uniref:ATP-binding protein n=1 Tax=Streptomyces sp. NRRL B-24572 TaxID=1962156 RepID=UPI000A371FC6|nr:ATP-binding protein [Streptomyces sp. NRRL B-24572]